jgi:hypothetical protein
MISVWPLIWGKVLVLCKLVLGVQAHTQLQVTGSAALLWLFCSFWDLQAGLGTCVLAVVECRRTTEMCRGVC